MIFHLKGRGAHASTLQLGGNFGQPEVENFRLPAGGDEYVSWLDIAMNDSLGVRRVQCVRDLDS